MSSVVQALTASPSASFPTHRDTKEVLDFSMAPNKPAVSGVMPWPLAYSSFRTLLDLRAAHISCTSWTHNNATGNKPIYQSACKRAGGSGEHAPLVQICDWKICAEMITKDRFGRACRPGRRPRDLLLLPMPCYERSTPALKVCNGVIPFCSAKWIGQYCEVERSQK